MKLTRIVNVILLPVIACTFTIAGAKLYYDFKSHVSSHLQQDVEFVLKEVDINAKIQHDGVLEFTSQLADSEEMFDYAMSSNTTPRHNRELVLYISDELVEDEQLDSGIYDVLITNTESNELAHINVEDPHAKFNPSSVLLATMENPETLNGREELSDVYYNYHKDHLCMVSIEYFTIQETEGTEIIGDDDIVWAAQVTSRVFLDELIKTAFYERLGQNVTVDVTTHGPGASETHNTIVSGLTDNNEIVTTISNGYYDVRVTVPKQFANDKFNELLVTVVTLLVITVIICFVVLRRLIHRAIIKPIVDLEKNVCNHDGNATLELMPNDTDNEVIALNNSYVKLLGKLNVMAKVDFLTGLPNRASFQYDISKAVQAHDYDNEVLSILFIDLDNFKHVNDNYGHKVGDDLLRQFSQDLMRIAFEQTCTKCKNKTCKITPYRLAGDEFAVIVASSSPKRPTLAENVAIDIISLFKDMYVVDYIPHDVKASIGLSEMTNDYIEPGVLLSNADIAMYDAKVSGKNCYKLFTEELKEVAREKALIAKGLHEAIDNNSFTLAFMPVYDTDKLSIDGVEVLLRCHEPTLKGFGPDKFIPVAESTGLIKTIDKWVLDTALLHLAEMKSEYNYTKTMSINISSAELRDPEFAVLVSDLLIKHSIEPSQVKLEITETSLVNDDVTAIEVLNQLKEVGVLLSLDDFGTGFTAFTQLMNYPVDELKIDRSFVDMIDKNAKDKKLTVDVIMDLANIYDLTVTAEGIETQEQVEYLKDLNCTKLQGFYLCKPIPYYEFVKIL